MNTTTTRSLLAAAFIALLALPAFAASRGDSPDADETDESCEKGEKGERGERHRGKRGEGRRGPPPPIAEKLAEVVDLSEDQASAITDIESEFQAASKPLREQMRTARKELRDLWKADPIDEDAIVAKEAEATALRSTMQSLATSFKLDVLNELTADQAGEAREMLAQMGPGHGRKRGGKGGDHKHGDREDRGERGERGERSRGHDR